MPERRHTVQPGRYRHYKGKDYDVIGVKSAHHFRGAFAPIAREVILCDSGALATHDVRTLPYRNVRRPVWPLDEVPGAA